ncbi:hypothetical protein C0993_000268 [Termitomyces sp. T159_Od127]|nr:hypothetical protein C0993_000268 [Termitomyces sp. T159_Od127]
MLVEMFAHAIDNPEPSLSTIILISGNRNFAYAMSTLRMRGFRIVLISPSTVHASLKAQASEYLDWYLDVLYAHHRALQDGALVGQTLENSTTIRPSSTAILSGDVNISNSVSPGAFSSALPRVAMHSVDQLSTSNSLSSEQINQLLPGLNSPQLAEVTLASVTLDRSRSISSALSSDPPKARSRETASTLYTQAASRSVSSPSSVVTRSVAPAVPVIYRPLVELLQSSRSKGVLQPLRSHIAAGLIKKDVGVYKSAHVKKFSQYASQAEAAGIIDLGGKDGGAWIRLRPELYDVALSN